MSDEPDHQPLVPVLVMGVQGSGKSTVGALLASRLGRRFIDGDTLHDDGARAKMAGGTPLSDADRDPWLQRVGTELAADDAPVVACSALRRRYRDLLREQVGGPLAIVHAAGSPDLLAERVAERRHEYMPASLLDSQLATLEPLQEDETGISVDVVASPQRLVDEALGWLEAWQREDAR